MVIKEAMFWEAAGDGAVRCGLCHQRCLIRAGQLGICGVRQNQDGKLYSLVYGHPAALAIDPIEKKPLYHFLPGSRSLSVATRGCNFRCRHCQNCNLSQVRAAPRTDEPEVAPAKIVARALAEGCPSISYTYTEPTVFFEYASDIARRAARQGLKNVFVTNGYITPEALRAIQPWLSAANIDLKFFDDAMYQRICGARLAPVLEMIGLYHELGIWIEITTLLIPTYNDSEEHARQIAEFIVKLDPFIPWHVSAFYPAYKMSDLPATGPMVLQRAAKIGRAAGLKHVYTGNILDQEGSATVCPQCKNQVIRRAYSGRIANELARGACARCGRRIAGVWQ